MYKCEDPCTDVLLQGMATMRLMLVFFCSDESRCANRLDELVDISDEELMLSRDSVVLPSAGHPKHLNL
jgi:hypothetical protein